MAEEAIDTGGPTREFWRLLVEEVVKEYCVRDPGMSNFTKNVPALHGLWSDCMCDINCHYLF